ATPSTQPPPLPDALPICSGHKQGRRHTFVGHIPYRRQKPPLGQGNQLVEITPYRLCRAEPGFNVPGPKLLQVRTRTRHHRHLDRSEEHTSELQSRENLVC